MKTKMMNESITPLEKNKIITGMKETAVSSSACCGGAPVKDESACCQLEEEKKAEGETACGCNGPEETELRSSCC